MRVGKPMTITAAMVTASSLSEPGSGETAWSNSAAYALDDEVISTTSHRKYQNLMGAVATVTFDTATDVVNWTAHGLIQWQRVKFSTTGGLPSGITAGTTYFVRDIAANSFKVSATNGGVAIDLTGTPTGVHTGSSLLNINYDPATDDGTRWLDIGPTNKFAAFDLDRNLGSVGTSPLTMTIVPADRVDFIGFAGIEAEAIEVLIKVGGVTVQTLTSDLLNRVVNNWDDWYFGEFRYRDINGFFGLPGYTSATYEITLTSTSAINTGRIVMGRAVEIGKTQYNPERGAVNYSKVTRDEDGNLTLVRKRSVPRASFTASAEKAQTQAILNVIEDLNAVPAFWEGIEDDEDGYYPAVTVFGIYTDLKVNLTHPENLIVSGTIEGM
jgi:hypothetical protein